MFGVFAVIFIPLTLAWVLDAILVDGAGDIWVGFAIVTGVFMMSRVRILCTMSSSGSLARSACVQTIGSQSGAKIRYPLVNTSTRLPPGS